MIQWFKTMTTNEYFKSQNATTKLWQRNYYEHIIRNEKSFNQICDYIIANPTNWESDKLYVKQLQKINEFQFTSIP